MGSMQVDSLLNVICGWMGSIFFSSFLDKYFFYKQNKTAIIHTQNLTSQRVDLISFAENWYMAYCMNYMRHCVYIDMHILQIESKSFACRVFVNVMALHTYSNSSCQIKS